jgi:hypothetical protein
MRKTKGPAFFYIIPRPRTSRTNVVPPDNGINKAIVVDGVEAYLLDVARFHYKPCTETSCSALGRFTYR